MLGRVGSSVGRLGIISANRGPNFSYTGTNAAFQSALTEAAYTGLVVGFSAPAYPQYWLRGVSYPSFLSVPGATYTRTGSRAGLDPSVVYSANVPRVAAGNGLRAFDADTNLVRSSDAPPTQSFTVTATAHTLSLFGTGSVTLSGVATGTLVGTGASNRVSLTFTPTAGTLTLTVSGSVTFAQVETGTFATDYIPNASTSASASVGADAAGVPFTLPTEYTIIMEWIEPAALPPGNRRIVGYSGSNVQSPCFLPAASPTLIRAWNGSSSIDGTTGARAAGSTQRAIYRQTASNRWLHYNGAQVATDANPMTTTGTCFIGVEDAAGVNALNSAVRIVSIIPRDIGATQANAVSVL